VRSETFDVVTILGEMTPFSFISRYRGFRGPCFLHLRGLPFMLKKLFSIYIYIYIYIYIKM
jgi:hypothetical protein